MRRGATSLMDHRATFARAFTGRSIFKFDLRATFPDQTLERNLSPHRKRIEICAGIPGVDGAYLLGDGAMQIVEHEAGVAADVPVQRRRIDRLPAAALAS